MPNIEKLATQNPSVDLVKVREAQTLIQKLRRQGADESKYDLVSPFDRRLNQERRARHEVALDLKPRR